MTREPFQSDTRISSFTHAEETLEFSSVLEVIASKCVNEGARSLVRSAQPVTDAGWIETRLREIEEVRAYQSINGRLPLVDTEPKTWIDRAVEKNELVPPEGCLAIAGIARSGLELQRSMEGETDYPLLLGIVSQMESHPDLVTMIDAAIDRDATVKDTASPKLQALRKNILKARDDLRRYSEKLARSFGSTDYATFTGTRHVLLVPRDKCRRKEGLVHSASHSGGSLYFEPFSLVEKNNALETLIHDERSEVTRILAGLTAYIVDISSGLLRNIRLWESLDALSAKARFSEEFDCKSPTLPPKPSIRLVDARHPLLEKSLREEPSERSVVPLNLTLGANSRVMVITGPNAGGKTVTLKTLGLLVLMRQAGIPIPVAEGSELPIFSAVFADIGDEQSIASSLSTFTSHLRHLDAMCRSATTNSLCLIDEIGDGTDPDEGAALAIATLERLQQRAGFIISTTHYGKVKTYALKHEGVINASMAFDDGNDKPLYLLLQGTAGRSRGLDTARRLGFDPTVIRHATSLVGEESYRLENVLSQLESSQLALERERDALKAQSDTLNRLIATYNEKEEAMREFKETHREEAKKEIKEMLLQTRKELEALVKRVRETEAEKRTVRETHERIKEMLESTRPKPKPKRAEVISIGEAVSLSPSGQPRGRVVEIQKDSVVVEINGKKISINKGNLYKVDPTDEDQPPVDIPIHIGVEPLHTTTVDVRGHDREEALGEVDRFLDRAVLSGVQEIKIIHGVGEGVLLRAIRELLQEDPRVRSHRQGLPGEGGFGVTLVVLR
ncbi:MAG: Smr/MutS family protein [Candidatus Latescibacterota bacterium]|nr:MAG: Smr/MutS family protein [Candidatus Latescibacterota bacterium]